MNHLEIGIMESNALEPTDFERWAAEVERRYGISSLDGDQASDGYSLDYALEAFMKGYSVEEYVATLPV